MELSEQEKYFLSNFRKTRECEIILGILIRRLEKAKSALIDAPLETFGIYQGKAKELNELVKLFKLT